jgi:AsmA family protein
MRTGLLLIATPLRRAALAFAAVVALLVVGLVVLERHAQPFVLRMLSAHTGRQIRVDGNFELHLLTRHPRFTADQVTIGNPAWMQPGTLASIGTVSADLLWQLSWRPLRIRRLELLGAAFTLVRTADTRANWHMSPEGPGKGPPLIESLYVPDARVDLNDERHHLQFSGKVSAQDRADAGAAPPLQIRGRGTLNGRKASIAIDGDPLATARADQPYHFTVDETSGAARLSGQGALERPFDMRALQATFEVTGPDMSEAYFLVGLHLPPTGAFRLNGRLERQGKRFFYRNLVATTGASDLRGSLAVDGSSGRTRIEGELTSEVLRLRDIGKAAAGHATDSDSDTPDTADKPLRLAGLSRSDWRISYRADELQAGSQVLTAVAASMSIEHGVLRLEHVAATLAGGSISADARLDGAASPPRAALEVSARDVQLEQLAHGAQAPLLSGAASGRIRLSGEGKSIHDLLSTANGTAAVLLPGGTLRESAAELASLDLKGALGVLLKSREQTPVRCGVASFEVHDGTATSRSLLLDTQKVLITGAGDVQMDSQALNLTLRGHPKGPRLGVRSAVAIRGTLRHPEFKLSGDGALAQAGIAVGLGVVLTPLAAILAFVDPGLAKNADCTELLQQAAAGAGVPQNLAQAHP